MKRHNFVSVVVTTQDRTTQSTTLDQSLGSLLVSTTTKTKYEMMMLFQLNLSRPQQRVLCKPFGAIHGQGVVTKYTKEVKINILVGDVDYIICKI